MKFTLKEKKPTADVAFDVSDGTITFTVAHIDGDALALDYRDAGKVSAKVRAALADAIVAWGLEREDGTPWECNAENKALLLPQLVNLAAKEKKDGEGRVLVPDGLPLGIALFQFAADGDNFLKN